MLKSISSMNLSKRLSGTMKPIRKNNFIQTKLFKCNLCNFTNTENKIVNRLKEKFQPLHLNVINESYKHNVPSGSESHFKVDTNNLKI